MDDRPAESVKKALKLHNIDADQGVVTSDDSVLLKISDKLQVDVYPNGDIVLLIKEGNINIYDEYAFSEIEDAISTLKDKLDHENL